MFGMSDIAELIEYLPDAHALFLYYDGVYFSQVLRDRTLVEWSDRMTLCAGTCSYSNSLCTIRLSRPLLKYRPFSDLVNTLLHEMIHAHLFLTQKHTRDRSSHGPQFCRMMDAINQKGLL